MYNIYVFVVPGIYIGDSPVEYNRLDCFDMTSIKLAAFLYSDLLVPIFPSVGYCFSDSSCSTC